MKKENLVFIPIGIILGISISLLIGSIINSIEEQKLNEYCNFVVCNKEMCSVYSGYSNYIYEYLNSIGYNLSNFDISISYKGEFVSALLYQNNTPVEVECKISIQLDYGNVTEVKTLIVSINYTDLKEWRKKVKEGD